MLHTHSVVPTSGLSTIKCTPKQALVGNLLHVVILVVSRVERIGLSSRPRQQRPQEHHQGVASLHVHVAIQLLEWIGRLHLCARTRRRTLLGLTAQHRPQHITNLHWLADPRVLQARAHRCTPTLQGGGTFLASFVRKLCGEQSRMAAEEHRPHLDRCLDWLPPVRPVARSVLVPLSAATR